MASEEMQGMAALLRAQGVFSGDSVDVFDLREQMSANLLPVDEDIRSEDVVLAGRPARHVAAPGSREDCGILYFHGGGYVLGSLDTHHELMGRLSRFCEAPVMGLDYRLAPEDPYPAALEDAVNAYLSLREQGIPAERILFGGDSAGGGLALACMQTLKDRDLALPAGAALFSPWTDLTASGDSTRTRAELDPMISAGLLGPMASLYRGSTDASDVGVSPLFGDLDGLPPLLIQVGDHEILLDDSTRLAARAEAAGVEVDLEIYDGAFHVFQNMPQLPESQDALTKAGAFFRRLIPA